jgi:hypothetical protein
VHQLSHQLVERLDAVCVEDLNLKSLAKTKQAKSWFDAAFGELFRQSHTSPYGTASILCEWTGSFSLLRRNYVPHVDTSITTFVYRIGNGNVPPVAPSRIEISTPPSTSKVKV